MSNSTAIATSETAQSEPGDMLSSVLYGVAVESFIELARTLSDEQWLVPIPWRPAWDVRDVLSHVAGIPDDVFAGRVGVVPHEGWIESQLERNRPLGVGELLERFDVQHVPFAEILDHVGQYRGPFSCHTHEHDIRHALDLRGNRDSIVIQAGAVMMSRNFDTSFPITVELDDGRSFRSGNGAGGDGVTVSGLSMFEIYRSRRGRRSRSQVEGYTWSGDDDLVAAAIDAWFQRRPTELPLIEN